MNTPRKGTLEYGAWNALDNAFRIRPRESVTIITDAATVPVAEAFQRQATELSQGGRVRVLVMEDFARPLTRPLTRLPFEMRNALRQADITIYAAGTREGELEFRMAMGDAAVGNGARHGHGPGLNEAIMLSGMQSDIPAANRRCEEVYRRLASEDGHSIVDWIHLTSERGTDLRLQFQGAPVIWDNSDWDITKPGCWHNIPSGEVFTWPCAAEGRYVVDGVLGDHFDQKYGPLANSPVTYEVEGGRITSISCPRNKALERELTDYVFSGPNENRIGEVGIGALEVEGLVSHMLQDEKMLGTVHIAHGNNYSSRLGAPFFDQKTHCDGIILAPTLQTSRGEFILKNGIYQQAGREEDGTPHSA